MSLRNIAAIGTLLLLIAGAARALDTSVPATGLPAAAIFSSTLLPDRQGVVSWKTLAAVETVADEGKISPRFSSDILKLDRQSVRVQGFVLALDTGLAQRHFLISAVPPHCPFCLPAGPDAIVEVFAKEPLKYSPDPVVLAGRFSVLKRDPSGVLYRLTEAVPVAATTR